MPKKIYVVDLTKEERTYLLDFIKSDKKAARRLNRARILLLADEGKTDSEIAAALHTGTATVYRTRERFVTGNLEGALRERPRPGGQKKLDEKGEAVLETLAHSQPPAGRKRWTLQLWPARLPRLKGRTLCSKRNNSKQPWSVCLRRARTGRNRLLTHSASMLPRQERPSNWQTSSQASHRRSPNKAQA